MKEQIEIAEYAQRIAEAIPKGVMLNTNGEKFNSMIISFGALGILWGEPAFTVYVREGRFTKRQLDETGEFTVSIPAGKVNGKIVKACGTKSGRDIDKAAEAGLTLEEPRTTATPGVAEYPITLECEVVFSQVMPLDLVPDEIREKEYPQDVPSDNPFSNKDPHVMYVGRIVDAYVIK